MRNVSSRGEHPAPFAFGAQSRFPHQPGYPFAGAAPALIAQFDVQTRTAIPALVGTKPLPNLAR